MAFKILNQSSAIHPIQAEPDSVDFDQLVLGFQGTGVITGVGVSAQAPTAMAVDVASGSVMVAGVEVTVNAISPVIGAADATNDRIDSVVVDNLGTVNVIVGTPSARPVIPDIPASSMILAIVVVPANATSIGTNEIVDKRVVVPETVKRIVNSSTPALEIDQTGTGKVVEIKDGGVVVFEIFDGRVIIKGTADFLVDTVNMILRDNRKLQFGTGADYWFYYDSTNTRFALATTDSDGIGTDADLIHIPDGSMKILIAGADSSPNPDSMLHIWEGSAGFVSARADSSLTLENNDNVSINFLVPSADNSTLYFGDVDDNDVAYLQYQHANDRFAIGIDAATRLLYSAGAFAFQEATTISTTTGDMTLSPAGNIDLNSRPVKNMTLGGIVTGDGNSINNVVIGLGTSASPVDSLLFAQTLFTNPVGSTYGELWRAQRAHTDASSNQAFWGSRQEPRIDLTNTQNWTAGIGLFGYEAVPTIESSSTGVITGIVSFSSRTNISDTGASVTNLYHYYIFESAIGSITNQYGLYINELTQGSSINRFIHIGNQLHYSDADFAFQKATTVSTSTGNLTLNPAGDIVIGTSRMFRDVANSTLVISGGSDWALGANVELIGESHSTVPDTGALRVDSTAKLIWNATGLGFFSATPVAQPTHIVDADGTLADITTKFNQLLSDMADLGLQAAL